MKINSKIKTKFKSLTFLCICLIVFFFQINSQILNAFPMDKYQTGPVIEELRLKVPSKFKEVWLKSEKKIWDPWLSTKEGFLGRQIFWDKEREEGLILVHWKNKTLWKSISVDDVNDIQEEYEKVIKLALNLNENPFELIYEGELDKQG